MMTIEQACTIYLDIHRMPTGDLRTDLVASARVAHQWRTVGPEATAVILHALHRHIGLSHREIEHATGISRESVRRLIGQLEAGKWGDVPR
ncbi:MAG: hypothetical protein ACREX8_06375 [Gammaproteobacteria bacterium]